MFESVKYPCGVALADPSGDWDGDDAWPRESFESFLACAGNDEVLAQLPATRSSSELAQYLGLLRGNSLDEAQLLGIAQAYHRLAAQVAAEFDLVLAQLAALPPEVPPSVAAAMALEVSSNTAHWQDLVQNGRADALAAVTGLSPGAASSRIYRASALAPGGMLGATGDVQRAGRLSESSARLIVDRLGALPDEVARRIEAAVLPEAPSLSWARLDRRLRREIAAANPVDEEQAALTARAARTVSRPMPLPDGMAKLTAEGPAEDIHLLWAALTACAEASPTAQLCGTSLDATAIDSGVDPAAGAFETVRIDARRFDALIGWACAAMDDPALPTTHARRPAIHVTVGLETLLDLNDQPAELHGHGPIAAEVARRIAADPSGRWRRLITDSVGRLGPYPIGTYRPPQELTDAVIARDQTCVFPNCGRAAERCDLDHRIPYPLGETSWENLQALCRRHHLLKTLGVWTTSRVESSDGTPSGDVRWTHLTGITAVRRAITQKPADPVVIRAAVGAASSSAAGPRAADRFPAPIAGWASATSIAAVPVSATSTVVPTESVQGGAARHGEGTEPPDIPPF